MYVRSAKLTAICVGGLSVFLPVVIPSDPCIIVVLLQNRFFVSYVSYLTKTIIVLFHFKNGTFFRARYEKAGR